MSLEAGGAPYPWLEGTWRTLLKLVAEQRLPHALLLTGTSGVGKQALAEAFAQYLACRDRGEQGACGQCSACQQFLAGSWPDFHQVTMLVNEKTGKLKKQIGVDQVRELAAEIGMTAQQGGWKTVLLQPADAMTVNAANSLLKTLEEPPDNSLLMLVTSRPASLLPTIRSRCQQLKLAGPSAEEGEAWLKAQDVKLPGPALAQAGGAPLAALELAKDEFLAERAGLLKTLVDLNHGARSVPSAAAEFDKIGAANVLKWLDSLLEDLIRANQLGVTETGSSGGWRNPDLLKSLKSLAEGLHLESMHRFRQAVRQAVRLEERSNVVPLQLLESLLVAWARRLDTRTVDQLLEG
ncbi:MAG: DNA polymerase III subunit delta' [Gammaproteobacteria bacterium]|nr:DNA polymerase III subunit delta' [Gammaproteobacteria bacterium]